MRVTVTEARWRRPSRLRRWGDLLRDVPLLLLDRVTEDDPRFLQLAMAALLVAFLGAMVLWCAAWATR